MLLFPSCDSLVAGLLRLLRSAKQFKNKCLKKKKNKQKVVGFTFVTEAQLPCLSQLTAFPRTRVIPARLAWNKKCVANWQKENFSTILTPPTVHFTQVLHVPVNTERMCCYPQNDSSFEERENVSVSGRLTQFPGMWKCGAPKAVRSWWYH